MHTGTRLLDRYRLEAEIGRGGMGLVYRAFDEQQQRVVAVKSLMLDQVPANEREETVNRFQREARASMILNHPHIVQVFDFVIEDGKYYLVMEYLEGMTLKQAMQGGMKLHGNQLMDVLIQICDGLHFAHQQGVIHRDIKPDNLFVTSQLRAKIMDFGIARQNTSEHFLLSTQPGTMLGTLSYMSPEQLQDSAMVDARTDIFSLGVVMYELFTGKLPFEGESMGQTVIKILTAMPVAPREVNAEIPAELEAAIQKAMIKRRGQRYQTTQDLAKDLLSLRGEPAAGTEMQTQTGPGSDWARKTFRASAADLANEQKTRPMGGSVQEQLEKEGLSLEGNQAQSLRDRDHGLMLECTADGLEAWLSVDPTYATNMPTRQSIEELLAKARVSFGISNEVIDTAVKQSFLERTLVAQGEAPLQGESARLEYLINEVSHGPAERDDGSVDFRELHLHSSVQAGTPLLRKFPAIPGEAGISIYGLSIPPHTVTDCKLLEGPGTALASDDTNLLIATRDGMPVRMASTCRVESVLELQDVGVATGNIRFDGTVVIQGIVAKGFKVEAGGDVIVHGTVEDASLRAGGNLYLYAPVYGGAQTLLSSRYQLHGQFIQQAKIECGGDLFVREALMHCNTRVIGKALIGGNGEPGSEGRGIVNGGELYGTHFAQMRVLGSASSTATLMAMGSHPQLDAQVSDSEAQMAVLRQKLQENIKNMIYLRTQGGAQSERMQALEAERSRLMFESNTLTDELQFLKDSLKQAENPRHCRIRVTEMIQPGVKVNISGAARVFDNPEPGPLSLLAAQVDARRREVSVSYG